MNILRSMLAAVALYSKVPVPQVEWNKKTLGYALAFFPLVGLLVSVGLVAWCWLAAKLAFGKVLFAAGATLVPVIITGGIHLDGWCDVSDALSSWQTRERRLEILKDSHIGAFALICLTCYVLAYFAVWTEIEVNTKSVMFMAAVYPLCRAISGWGIANLRCAKTSGLVATFANNAHRRGVSVVLVLWLAVISLFLLAQDVVWAVCGMLVAAACFAYYRYTAYSKFGGINGDLAGWFLQILELGWLILLLVLQKLAL